MFFLMLYQTIAGIVGYFIYGLFIETNTVNNLVYLTSYLFLLLLLTTYDTVFYRIILQSINTNKGEEQ